jgi:sec-independent protein translocase protein TatA
MILGVPQVGGIELLILLAIILLFFGARHVPELGRSLGKSMLEFRKGASEDPDDKGEARNLEEGELPFQEGAILDGVRTQKGKVAS